MIPSAFDYARATSLDDALARMQAAGGAGKLIAGGHSLVPLMKLRLSEPQLLIDISRVPELSGIRERDGKVVIGACTVHHDVATSALLRERCPAIAEAAADLDDLGEDAWAAAAERYGDPLAPALDWLAGYGMVERGTADGADVRQWTWLDNTCQQFTLVPVT